MRRTTTLLAVCLLLAGAAAGCSKSQAEIEDDCYAAITDKSDENNRPEECESLSQNDYDTLRMGWFLEKEGLGNVDENPEDLLDYSDDGEVNDSLG